MELGCVNSENELDILQSFSFYNDLVLRIQKFYLPSSDALADLLNTHTKYGYLLTEIIFIHNLKNCYEAGLSLPSAAISANLMGDKDFLIFQVIWACYLMRLIRL